MSTIIIGAKNEEQLKDNLAVTGLELAPQEIAELDKVSALPRSTRAGCSISRAAGGRRLERAETRS